MRNGGPEELQFREDKRGIKKYGNMFNQNYVPAGMRNNYASTPNLAHLPDIHSPSSSFFHKREVSIPDLAHTPNNQFAKSFPLI